VSETFYFVEGGRAAEATSNNNKCIEFWFAWHINFAGFKLLFN
jgi:hypothetical protein